MDVIHLEMNGTSQIHSYGPAVGKHFQSLYVWTVLKLILEAKGFTSPITNPLIHLLPLQQNCYLFSSPAPS